MEKMTKSTNIDSVNIQSKNQKSLDGSSIILIKKFLNYFWEFVDILSYKSDKAAKLYEKSIGEEYKHEYETYGISKDKKVLHIGCGAYPLSEIALANLFGVEVVGIDKNPKAVKLANEVISKKKLDTKVKIEHGDGTNYSVEKYDVIIVSSCSIPKVKILDNIFKKAKKQSTIVIREINIATDAILESIDYHKDVVFVKKVRHHPGSFLSPIAWNAIYLTKK